MKKLNLKNVEKIYFIGIGGISMSALARLMRHAGKTVAGSDSVKSDITIALEQEGVTVFYNQLLNHIAADTHLVVYTGAIGSNNAELVFAKTNGIPVIERAAFLGEICGEYENTIAVSGTHGKTTTTALIASIFNQAQFNPTVHVGGIVTDLGSNLQIGETRYIITEACEYKRSFLKITPQTAIITSVEKDHMDCYNNLKDLKNAFSSFAKSANTVITNCSWLTKGQPSYKAVLCGLEPNCNFYGYNLVPDSRGCYSFDVRINGKFYGHFKLNIMGKYNVLNALFAIAAGQVHGIHKEDMYKALYYFKGINRRNERLGEINGAEIYADYAHHPTEIVSSLQSFKSVYKRVLCVFQPHTYSRTKELMKQFKKSFNNAAALIVFKTYPAREEVVAGGEAADLFKNVKVKNKVYCNTKEELIKQIEEQSQGMDVILILGAGDMYDALRHSFTHKQGVKTTVLAQNERQ